MCVGVHMCTYIYVGAVKASGCEALWSWSYRKVSEPPALGAGT